MAEPRLKFDESKSYILKGSTLRRLCKAANEWTNLKVVWGAAASQPGITRGEVQSVITIPQWGGGGSSNFPHPFQVSSVLVGTTKKGQILVTTQSYAHKSESEDAGEKLTITNLHEPFTLNSTTCAWIELKFDKDMVIGAAELKTGSTFPDMHVTDTPDGETVERRTMCNLPVGRVIDNIYADDTETPKRAARVPGFTFTLGDNKYQWQQMVNGHLLCILNFTGGYVGYKLIQWQGIISDS